MKYFCQVCLTWIDAKDYIDHLEFQHPTYHLLEIYRQLDKSSLYLRMEENNLLKNDCVFTSKS